VPKDYYSILELSPISTYEDIQKKYFSLAKVLHPDVSDDIPSNGKRFKDVNEAYSILSNSEKRREYDESLKSGKVATKSASMFMEKNGKTAALAFQQAKNAIRSGIFEQAIILLKSAVKNDSSVAAYHSWYGFSLAMANSNLHEARDECKKAVQMEFYNSNFRANLGFVYFRAGLKKQAVANFTSALKWDPENKLAKKYMAKFEQGVNREQGPIDKIITFFKKHSK
jgi:curved DNA-binding protein CbpA